MIEMPLYDQPTDCLLPKSAHFTHSGQAGGSACTRGAAALEGCALWLFKRDLRSWATTNRTSVLPGVAIGVLQPALPIVVAPPGRFGCKCPAAPQRTQALQNVHIVG
jgi:hypothetical protein